MNMLSVRDRTQLMGEATAQFWQHFIPIVRIALGIHALWFFLFIALQLPLMAVGNVLSVLLYVVCLKAIHAGRYTYAGMLMSVEIILHALLATWVLGWQSNFHFYLYCLVPIIAFSFHTARRLRLLINLAIVSVAVGCFAMRGRMGIDSGVDPLWLEMFGIVNVLTATGLLLHGTALSVRFTREMQVSLFHTANRDSLTNLYTRRRVMRGVRQLAESAPSAIIVLDIDHFKQINDQLGHEQGDLILQRVAEAINANVRASDLASRWGGEEFLVLMADTAEQEANIVAERILLRIREWVGQAGDTSLIVTATLAVSEIRRGESFESALSRADQALYQGKRQGRNQVVLAT